MDSLLFLIKKHNYNKMVGCNDKLPFYNVYKQRLGLTLGLCD